MGLYTWQVKKCLCSTVADSDEILDLLTTHDDEGWEFVSVTKVNGHILFIWRKKNI